MRYQFTSSWLYRNITWAVLRVVDRRVAAVLATAFGLYAALLPLLLWVAWSREVFDFILFSGGVSIALFTLLAIAISPEGKSKGFDEWKRMVKEYDHGRSQQEKQGWRDVS